MEAQKIYEVLPDQKYTGAHRVYSAGEQFPAAELFGTEEGGLELALEGRKEVKDKEGNVTAKAVAPRIKEVKASSKGGK